MNLEAVDPDVAEEELAIEAEGPHPVVVGGHDGVVALWDVGFVGSDWRLTIEERGKKRERG